MLYPYLPLIFVVVSAVAFFVGRYRAQQAYVQSHGQEKLHSLPSYHGFFMAFCVGLPALLLWSLWQVGESTVLTYIVRSGLPTHLQDLSANEFSLVMNDIRNTVSGSFVSAAENLVVTEGARIYLSARSMGQGVVTSLVLGCATLCFILSYRRIQPQFRSRNVVEKIISILLVLCSGVAILTTLGIVLSVLFESIRFFKEVPVFDFLFGLQWSPQTAMRADQAGSSGAFGVIPIFTGTILIAFIAMCVAIPIGLMAAIYLSEYASAKVRAYVKPMLEILAGIPTVVYGFFAALTVAPMIRKLGETMGFEVASESALAAGLVMGIMIIPFVSSLSDDVIHAVPQSMRDGSFGLGATQYETIRNVVLPAALPGVVGSILLAVSRAVGETMIVVMAAGLSANLSFNPLTAVTTITVQIVTLLTGDQEFDSAKTLAAFALGLFLFGFTLILNVVALQVVRKYREQYE